MRPVSDIVFRMAKKKPAARRKKKPAGKGGPGRPPLPPRTSMLLRLDPEVAERLQSIADAAGLSRNALAVMVLRQATDMWALTEREPQLFALTDALVDSMMRRALGRAGVWT